MIDSEAKAMTMAKTMKIWLPGASRPRPGVENYITGFLGGIVKVPKQPNTL